MKLSINKESADALRIFAEAMPIAIENIAQSTGKLIQIYQSVADTFGLHTQDFHDMLIIIKKAQETATEAIQVLPPMLISTADEIDAYLAQANDNIKESSSTLNRCAQLLTIAVAATSMIYGNYDHHKNQKIKDVAIKDVYDITKSEKWTKELEVLNTAEKNRKELEKLNTVKKKRRDSI